MITYVSGNLFQSPAKVLVNTVNTVGIMGKGIAYDFRQIYPDMFAKYQEFCEKKQIDIGKLWLYKTPYKWILNFPTKKHWREKSKPEYIEKGLQKFVETYDQRGITSISFPLLGCGNGELDWDSQVKPLMEKYLRNLPINIYVHLYRQNDLIPEHKNVAEISKWLHSEPENLAFDEVLSDLRERFKHQNMLTTYESNLAFSAIMSSSNNIIVTPTKGEPIDFPEAKLLVAWQFIRSAGYVVPHKFPNNLDDHAEYLVAIFAELEYIDPVKITLEKGEEAVGLQIIPKSKQQEETVKQLPISIEPIQY